VESSNLGSKVDHFAASSSHLCETTELGLHSPASKSQRVYSRRVKEEEIAKQLLKNKGLIAEVVADCPVKGYSKEVMETMNFAPVMGLSWGGDDKRMMNLLSVILKEKKKHAAPTTKDLEAGDQRSSQVKC
jgi:hypothetical protein